VNTIASRRARLRAQEKVSTRKGAILGAQKSSIAPYEHTQPSPAKAGTPPSTHSKLRENPHHRNRHCYHYFSASDGIQANIHGRFVMRMRRTRGHNKRVMAFREAQEYWETEFGNWFSKLSQELRADGEDESEEKERDVGDSLGLVLDLADDLWRSESSS
jgi:hypothetical protein